MITERQNCFQFKASFSPCTILQMTRYDLTELEKQLNDAIAAAPNFFLGSPVVIDLEKITHPDVFNFVQLKQILIKAGLVPVGIRGIPAEQKPDAVDAGLPIVTIGKASSPLQETPKKKKEQSHAHTTKCVTQPIRSGMQVYAKEGDLIVIAPVSNGAELLADGHIHVYGPLRGRALAGIQGNIHARIFCHKLEAELVSIAGYYLTKEDLQSWLKKEGMLQIYLEKDQVRVEAI